MSNPILSPLLAVKAGNRTQIELEPRLDPVFQAYSKWNELLVLAGPKPTVSEEPVADDRAYSVEGSEQKFCRPWLKLAERTGLEKGLEVSFERRDDGLHLTAAFVEDPAKRVSGAVPFQVRIKSVQLKYGNDPADVLAFADPVQEPMDPAEGPAFRVAVDTAVTENESLARMLAAMQAPDSACWTVTMDFEWIKLIPAAPPESGPPATPFDPRVAFDPTRIAVMHPFTARPAVTDPAATIGGLGQATPIRPIGAPALFALTGSIATIEGPELVRAILRQPPPPPEPTRQVETIIIERRPAAFYPKTTASNRAIFAAIDGDYVQAGWRSSSHGWYQPTPIQDTVYCLPDAYRLQVDEVTGYPSIQAVLLRKNSSGELVDDLDPALYKTRLTLKVRPDFDAERLDSLRALIRGESSNEIKYADLVLGGYSGARFVADDALAGLGELFAGSTAGDEETIDPAEGFTLTYEGNAEFIDLIFQRLKGEGIGGSVELDLNEPGGRVRKHRIPVSLTLRRLAPLTLEWELVPQPMAPDAQDPPAEREPQDFRLRNPTPVTVRVAGLQAYALQKTRGVRRVAEWCVAKPEGMELPLVLAGSEGRTLRLRPESPTALPNAWDITLLGVRPELSDQLVLDQLFDAATAGVRGWRVEIECPPLAFFDQLKPEEQALIEDVVAIEIEVRRLGSNNIEEVNLSRQKPRGTVLLSRTVADFVTDRSTGRSVFEYRQRVQHRFRAEEPTAWRQETGSHLSVFLTG